MERISERESKLASVLMALMICSKLMNVAIPKVYSGGIQSGMITMGLIWGIFVIYVFIYRKNNANLKAACFIAYFLLFFIISNLIYSDHIRLLTLHFIEYGLAGFLIAGTGFNVEKTMRYTAYLTLILAYPIVLLLQSNYSIYSESLGMGISYALLSPALTIVAHLLYYRKKNDYLIYLAYAFSMYLLYQIIVRGIRGSILCILVLIFFAVLNNDRFRGTFSIRRGAVLAVVFIGLLNADYLLTATANALSSIGIHIRFIEKTIALGNVIGDVSNGRIDIYSVAIKDFFDSPIWGKGIGYFPEVHGINYPHNLILQVLGEGGLLLGIPIILVIIRIIYDLIFGRIENRDLRVCILLLTSCTIPAAFVSDEIWNYQLLWLLFGILLKKVVPQERRKVSLAQQKIEGNVIE